MKKSEVKIIEPHGASRSFIFPPETDPEFKRAIEEAPKAEKAYKEKRLKASIDPMRFPSETIILAIYDYYYKIKMLDSGKGEIVDLPSEMTREEAIEELRKEQMTELSEILFPFVRGSIAHYLTEIETLIMKIMEKMDRSHRDEGDTHIIDHYWIDDKSFSKKLNCLEKELEENGYLETSCQSSKFLKNILEILSEAKSFRNYMSHSSFTITQPFRLEFYDKPKPSKIQFVDLDYETSKFLVKYLWKLSYVMEMISKFKLSEIERVFENYDFKTSYEFIRGYLKEFKNQIKTAEYYDKEKKHWILKLEGKNEKNETPYTQFD